MNYKNLKIKGPSTITVMNNGSKQVILLGDIHLPVDYDEKTCTNFQVPNKKIDYFIEYSYDFDFTSDLLLRKYTECILKNKKHFNPYLIDNRQNLELNKFAFYFMKLLNSKIKIADKDMYKTEDLINTIDNLKDKGYMFEKSFIKDTLKKYFDIVNLSNNLKLKPPTSTILFFLNSLKIILEENIETYTKLTLEYDFLYPLLKKDKLISSEIVNKFLLSFIKIYKFSNKITELIFDTYVLSGILQSENNIIIVHAGQQHINTYVKFLHDNGFTLTYTYKN